MQSSMLILHKIENISMNYVSGYRRGVSCRTLAPVFEALSVGTKFPLANGYTRRGIVAARTAASAVGLGGRIIGSRFPRSRVQLKLQQPTVELCSR